MKALLIPIGQAHFMIRTLAGKTLHGVWLVLLGISLAACGSDPTSAPTPIQVSPTPLPSPEPTPTALPPTPTAIPLAAVVNGEPITLDAYQLQMDLLLAAQAEVGTDLATGEAARRALEELISQALLAQAARETGFEVTEEMIQERVHRLSIQVGGEEALATWQAAHGYTAETFYRDLTRALAAAWMRDRIQAALPAVAEQVHAHQILLYNSEDAQRVYGRLQSGADFTALARAYDPQGFGDLGWFPQGYLTEPAIEAAAFSLQPGEISSVIETRLGFHILQVIERLPDRPLDPDARLALQAQALESWLAERREQSEIQVMLADIP